MVSLKQISELQALDKIFYDSKDLSVYLEVSGRTLENTIKKLLDENVLTSLEKGKYYVTSKKPNEFQIAQFLYNPSYISFETALNYYGILPQFPQAVTSATTKRARSKLVSGKEYSYSHISKNYFTGYENRDGFLIATAEKALIDQIYFSFKSLRSIDNLDEYDVSKIDKNKAKEYAELIEGSLGKRIVTFVNENV
ncbi:MAG: type IV toxin-antitoxin system AbiEi family antitoxin domain-containing protein [Patescibacteria group bacterium]|jgi:predicted transcriptional regulator of viral defense system